LKSIHPKSLKCARFAVQQDFQGKGIAMRLTIACVKTQRRGDPLDHGHGHYKGPIYQPNWAAFREGLASLGYVEGKNLRIELREADGHYERLPDLAADLIKLEPAVLVGAQLPATLALKAATTIIPIVCRR
jgi:GNAT superfamily N-acetyltransferase